MAEDTDGSVAEMAGWLEGWVNWTDGLMNAWLCKWVYHEWMDGRFGSCRLQNKDEIYVGRQRAGSPKLNHQSLVPFSQ